MTTSQLTSAVAAAVTFFAALDTKVDVLTAVLPPKWAGWLRAAVIVAGILVGAFSQSLNPNHISIPTDEAKRLGVAPSQTRGR